MPAQVKPLDMFDAVLAALWHLLGWQTRTTRFGDRDATGPADTRSANVANGLSTHGVGEERNCVLLRPRSGFGES